MYTTAHFYLLPRIATDPRTRTRYLQWLWFSVKLSPYDGLNGPIRKGDIYVEESTGQRVRVTSIVFHTGAAEPVIYAAPEFRKYSIWCRGEDDFRRHCRVPC